MPKVFTTQWKSENIEIQYCDNIFLNFYIYIFFKSWIRKQIYPTKHKVIIQFSKEVNKPYKYQKMYSYNRISNKHTIITTFSNIKIKRALIRSVYKLFSKKSVIGVAELYMSVIRKGVIEPIEYLKSIQGWSMIHACVFKLNSKLFVISAASKIGKSTLIDYLIKYEDVSVLSDNYCFIKGDCIKTIEEPFRFERKRRFSMSFYGRSISGYPECFEGKVDKLIVLKRGSKNKIDTVSNNKMNKMLNQINQDSQEGISFLDSNDVIMTHNRINNQGKYMNYEVQIAEGLHNIPEIINLLKKIK
jgi:hypothetical protein